MTEQRYSLVTVVFDAELSFLALQARSARLYANEQLIEAIFVINNARRPWSAHQTSVILDAYGPLQPLVTLLHHDELCDMPFTEGWRSQQVLKLAIASRIPTERYIVLDAKTHFVFPLTRPFLEAVDGRANVNVYSYVDHPLRGALEHVLKYLKLDPAPYLSEFTATVAPFTLYTNVVKIIISDLEKASNRSFAAEFVRSDLTEFFLYGGYLYRSGEMHALYHFHQVFCPIIWEHTATPEGCEAAILTANTQQTPFFAVHRSAIVVADEKAAELIATFWASRQLFQSVAEGEAFIDGLRQAGQAHQKAQRLVLPFVRAASLPRRGLRKLKRKLETLKGHGA
jgi:hypothetical protein